MSVQKADAGARRRALVLLGAGTLVGASAVLTTRRVLPAVSGWVADDVEGRLPLVAAILAAMPSLPLVAFGVYLWRLGSRVVDTSRFPPRDMPVIRDTPVVEGVVAVRRGRMLRAAGIGLVGAAMAVALVVWRLLAGLAGRI